jgi:hypothetical protein
MQINNLVRWSTERNIDTRSNLVLTNNDIVTLFAPSRDVLTGL